MMLPQSIEFGADGHHPIQRGAVKSWEEVEKVWARVMDDMNISVADNVAVK